MWILICSELCTLYMSSVGELFLPILCLDTTSEYVQKIFQEPSQEMTVAKKELYMKFYNGNIRKLLHNFPDVRLL